MHVIFILLCIFIPSIITNTLPKKSITMFPCTLLHFLLFLIFPRTLTAADPPAYTAVDLILLNCGDSSASSNITGRTWFTDERSGYVPPNAASTPSAFAAFNMYPSGPDSVLYRMARVFRSNFTYSIPVSGGHKFIRLYFYPDTYAGFRTSESFFSVTANGFTLLSNFSALFNSPNPEGPLPSSFLKEFIIYVQGDQKINLTFSPNPNSFAFINGIEVVSLPDDLYFRDKPIKSVNEQATTILQNDTALEKLFRLNVGGSEVQPPTDSGPARGMFRSWESDNPYIVGSTGYTPHDKDHPINYTAETPPYSAPKIVYRTSRVISNYSKRLDWVFRVDSGFRYLLRLHFCEIQLEITKQNQRVFTIEINNETAEIQADVIYWTGDTGIPIFKDYTTWVSDDGRRGKKELWLSLYPNIEGSPLYSNALLNGLEIFKLNDANRSLAAANRPPPASPAEHLPPLPSKKKRSSSIIFVVVGGVIGVLAVASVMSFLIFWRRKKVKDSTSEKSSWVPLPTDTRTTTRTSGSSVTLPSDLCRQFTLREIMTATGNFDKNFIIGKGGFGNVYKGLIDNCATTVAVKRLNTSSNQGAHEFLTEIDMLSKLRHRHLVSLIGYCNENGEMILVYDYMAHGTLRDHLYNSDKTPLRWKDRLQICLGAAKGLDYLHTGAKHAIIHRDVKSTNILLDEKWVAKMSDFGLSKVGPTNATDTHVSTAVKGSIGYVDPEYWRLRQLTEKSDVYSFGVVLFEVLCARSAVIPNAPRDKVNLAEWAKINQKRGTINQIVDANLKGQIDPVCLNKFVEIGIACLQEKGIERPAMKDVVWSLEFALDLQETAERGGRGNISPSPEFPLMGRQKDLNTTTDDELFSGTDETATWTTRTSGLPSSDSSERLKSLDVFSEIRNPTGR